MSEETSFMHLVRPSVAAPAASSTTGPCNIRIDTSACFQILEIVSKQILSSNKRIIGTLVGFRSDDGSEFDVRDAFMVPCTETGDSIAIDDHAHKALYQLYKKAHPKEHVLGWFDSSNKIDANTGLIHDFYSKGTDRAYPFPAIYLNVEYLGENQEITFPKISTYIGAAIGKLSSNTPKIGWNTANTTSSYIFTPVPNKVINSTISEKLVINHLSENQQNNEPISVSANSRTLSHLSNQLSSVGETIDKLLAYIESTSNSDSDIDLLRLLSNTLLNKPQYLTDLKELEYHFRAHNQDVIMIEYLTKAVKEQIELSARLTASSEADKK